MTKTSALAPVVIAAALAVPGSAVAQAPGGRPDLPLWEAGVGGGVGYSAQYPASGEYDVNGIGFPYVIYRSDFLRIGDGGVVRGIFVDTDRFEFDIGLDASFPADSDDNPIRRGMPDLDFLFEIGPELIFKLSEPGARIETSLEIEARAVFETDFSYVDYEGFVINPELKVRHRGTFGPGSSLTFTAGPIFGFDGLNKYFYEVAPAFALPSRPAFAADEGYMGTEFGLSATGNLSERVRYFARVGAGYYGGAASEDSPLHEEDWNVSVFAGFAWSLWQSEARATRR